jgi:hypothetical protein
MAIPGIDISDLASQTRITEGIGSVTANQLGTVMAQQSKSVASANSLTVDEMTNRIVSSTGSTAESIIGSGVGKYGITAQALEDNNYIKPGTVDRFLDDPAQLENVLSSPTVWTGKEGITAVESLLGNGPLQSVVQTDIMSNALSGLKSTGTITGFEDADIVAGVTNVASKFGVGAANDWIAGNVPSALQGAAMDLTGRGGQYAIDFVDTKLLPGIGDSSLVSNSINGIVGGVGDVFGNVTSGIGDFAGGLADTIGLGDVSFGDIGFGDITGSLGDFAGGFGDALGQFGTDLGSFLNGGMGDMVSQITGGFADLGGEIFGDLTGSLSGSLGDLAGSIGGISAISDVAGNLIGGLGGSLTGALSGVMSGALGNLFGGAIGGLFGGGGGSGPVTITPPAVTQTVKRSGIDNVVTNLIGNPKVPSPNYTGIVTAANFQLPSLSGLSNTFNNVVSGDQPVEVCSCSDPTLIGPTKSECEAAGGKWTCYTVNNKGTGTSGTWV